MLVAGLDVRFCLVGFWRDRVVLEDARQQLFGFRVPVGDEDGVDAGDHGAFHAEHEVFPLEGVAAGLGSAVVVARDEVLRAEVRDSAVDDK